MSNFQTKIIKQKESEGYYVINLMATNKNGIPDLLCLKKDEAPLFIECKEKKDTLKKLQEFRIKDLRELGFKSVCLKEGKGIIF